MGTEPADPFYAACRGPFSGILRWRELDALWNRLRERAGAGWYIYAVGQSPPQTPAAPEELLRFVGELDRRLRKEHREDYCGIVYVDDRKRPEFIKIFDPANLGVVCGYSDNPPPPGWILCRVPPKPLENQQILTARRKRWWQRLWRPRQP